MTSTTTKPKPYTTWRCDRCGHEAREEGEDENGPPGWRLLKSDDNSPDRDLCADCVVAFEAFVARRVPFPPQEVSCSHSEPAHVVGALKFAWCDKCGALQCYGQPWKLPELPPSSSELHRLRSLHELGIQAQNDLDALVTELNSRRPIAVSDAVHRLRETLSKWIHECDRDDADQQCAASRWHTPEERAACPECSKP